MTIKELESGLSPLTKEAGKVARFGGAKEYLVCTAGSKFVDLFDSCCDLQSDIK